MDWLFGLQIAWGIVCWISMVVYIIFLVTIVKNRKKKPFDSPFFKICAQLGLYDLGVVAIMYFSRIVPKPPTRLFGQSPRFVLYYYCQTGEHISILLLAANRYCFIVHPIRGKQLWMRLRTSLLAVNIFVPPLLTIGSLLVGNYEVRTVWDNETNGNVLTVACRMPNNVKVHMAAGMFTVNALCSIIYAAAVWNLICRRSEEFTATVKAEMRLMFGGIMIFLTLILYAMATVYNIHATRQQNGKSGAAKTFMMMSGELYAVVNPYMLLICSAPCRREFAATCRHIPIIRYALPKLVVTPASVPIPMKPRGVNAAPFVAQRV